MIICRDSESAIKLPKTFRLLFSRADKECLRKRNSATEMTTSGRLPGEFLNYTQFCRERLGDDYHHPVSIAICIEIYRVPCMQLMLRLNLLGSEHLLTECRSARNERIEQALKAA